MPRRHLWICFFIFGLFYLSPGTTFASYCYYDLPCTRHQLEIGPEIFHVKRTRKGGTQQHGFLYGFRASYDYIKRYKPYVGLEVAYAEGTLHGKNHLKDHLKSHFSEQCTEGRMGYTLQSKTGCCAQLVPFIGYGYFVERNDYVRPSPVDVHFRNTFYYTALGVLTRAFVTPCFTMGLNITTKFSIDGKCKVSHDPKYDKATMMYENMVHCRAAVPFCYRWCACGRSVELSFVPFYEYRHYGHHHNVPFDFIDTKIKDFGFDLFYVFRF